MLLSLEKRQRRHCCESNQILLQCYISVIHKPERDTQRTLAAVLLLNSDRFLQNCHSQENEQKPKNNPTINYNYITNNYSPCDYSGTSLFQTSEWQLLNRYCY